jgi:MoxR-like ATPase
MAMSPAYKAVVIVNPVCSPFAPEMSNLLPMADVLSVDQRSAPQSGFDANPAAALAKRIVDNVERVLHGKRSVIELTLIALIAEGHVLVEDVPGVGKTLLAKSLAASLSAPWRRVQFTPDLLPSDVVGVSVWDTATSTFRFHPGPVFTNILLCDEVNRAPEKTQSALLEAMEERQVTGDGVTRPLPQPFFVIATQNPFEHRGTYSLPESQLDRFIMRISLGYPDREATLALLDDDGGDRIISTLTPVASLPDLRALNEASRAVHTALAIKGYVADVVQATRRQSDVRLGASPRAAIALVRACRASALCAGRTFVTPDDVQRLAVPVLAHRVHVYEDADITADAAVQAALSSVPVPVPRRA